MYFSDWLDADVYFPKARPKNTCQWAMGMLVMSFVVFFDHKAYIFVALLLPLKQF